jgi:hypothetical protein
MRRMDDIIFIQKGDCRGSGDSSKRSCSCGNGAFAQLQKEQWKQLAKHSSQCTVRLQIFHNEKWRCLRKKHFRGKKWQKPWNPESQKISAKNGKRMQRRQKADVVG